MKNKFKRIGYLVLIPLIILTILLFPTNSSNAASLNSAYIMLNRMQAGITSGLEMYVALETSTTFTPESEGIILEFPATEDSLWCRTAGTDLVITGITSTPADGGASNPIAAALPGTLTGRCIQGGASTADQILIDGATSLTANTVYGFKIEEAAVTPSATLGTAGSAGAHIVNLTARNQATETTETKSFAVALVSDDTVDVTATVLEVQTVTCTIAPTTVSLGNLYQGGVYVTGSHEITTSTSSSAGGYYWVVYGTGDGTDAGLVLDGGGDQIYSTGSAKVDLSGANSEGFGMRAGVPDTGAATVVADFNDSNLGIFGALDSGVSGARLFLYQNAPQTSVATSIITYGARADSTATAGNYSETVTFICGGYY